MHQERSVLQKFLQKPCYTRKSATWKLRKLIPFLRTLSSAARWRSLIHFFWTTDEKSRHLFRTQLQSTESEKHADDLEQI